MKMNVRIKLMHKNLKKFNRKNYSPIRTMLTIVVYSFIQSVGAQVAVKTDSVYNLNEVVVTYQASKRTPVSFQVIDQDHLSLKNDGQAPSVLFSETPSVTFYSDAGNPQGYSYIRLRGIDQTRINISLDGMPLNEPEDQGAYFANYPDLFNSVSKVQLQRGVGLTKNGVASYAGSIQLSSPNLHDSTQLSVGFGYGSFNTLRLFGEYNSGIRNEKGIYVRASQLYSEGYKLHSSNHSQSLFMSSGWFTEQSTLKLNILAGFQQNELAWLGVPDSLLRLNQRWNANSEQEKDKFLQVVTQLHHLWQLNPQSFLQSGIFYSHLTGNYDFDYNNFMGWSSTDELYNYAFGSHWIGLFSNYTYTNKNINWSTGLYGSTYVRTHTGSEKQAGELYTNKGIKKELSFFSKAEYHIDWLTLFADINYRTVRFDYEGSVFMKPLRWNFINPKAGFSASVQEQTVVYYSIGSTGREPTRNDIAGGNDDLLTDENGVALLYNTQPEYVFNHELGIRTVRSPYNLTMNFYLMDFKNEIVLDGKFGPNGLALTNKVEKSIRTGVELSLRYRITPQVELINNSSFNYSRIWEQGEQFVPILTPPIIINQEILYKKNQITLSISGRYQQRSFMDYANTAYINSYFVCNARAGYTLNNTQFNLNIYNLTNTRYYNQAYIDVDGTKKYFVQSPLSFNLEMLYNL